MIIVVYYHDADDADDDDGDVDDNDDRSNEEVISLGMNPFFGIGDVFSEQRGRYALRGELIRVNF